MRFIFPIIIIDEDFRSENASGLGNAYAGSAAVADNASTIYFNPAGMTQLQDREVSMGGTLVKTSFDFKDNGSSVGTLAGSGNGNDGGTLGFIPNAYMSWALSKRPLRKFFVGRAPASLMMLTRTAVP